MEVLRQADTAVGRRCGGHKPPEQLPAAGLALLVDAAAAQRPPERSAGFCCHLVATAAAPVAVVVGGDNGWGQMN